MDVTLRLARIDEKPAIEALLKQYLTELGAWGYGEDYPFSNSYWREERRWPYFIEADGQLAGFFLVNAQSISGYKVDAAIAEFFILPQFRRKGYGVQAALAAFRAHPGQWELSFHCDNAAACRFWSEVIECSGARSTKCLELASSKILRFFIAK